MKKKGVIAFILLWIAIPGTLLISLAVFAMYPPIAMRLFALFPSRNNVRETLRTTFISRGLNPDWIDAIAFVESRWNVDAVNRSGGDAARGGSFGATQLSLKTLRGLGYTGTGEQLLGNVQAQADWSAALMQANNPSTFEDAASMWNAGVPFDSLANNSKTKTDYIPKAQSALNYVVGFA